VCRRVGGGALATGRETGGILGAVILVLAGAPTLASRAVEAFWLSRADARVAVSSIH
jgi:hypothetical protein